MNLTVIILAAGKGTRMKTRLPKVMHKLAGVPLIEHTICIGSQLSAQEIRVVTNDRLIVDPSFIELQNKYNFKTFIQKDQKGTAHALQCAELEGLESKYTLVLYGDTPLVTTSTIEKMLISIQENKAAICVFGFTTENNCGYGRLIAGENHSLLDIIEEKDASSQVKEIKLCNSGLMLFETAVCSELIAKITNHNIASEYYLTSLIKVANQEGYLCTYIEGPEDEAKGVNDLQQLSTLENLLQEKIRCKMMREGVHLIAPQTTFFSIDTQIAADVVIHPNVIFGLGVSIESNSEIFSFSHFEHCKIGKNCKVGPFARLRPNSILVGDNKVGNFVELKNATLDNGTKAPHLTYIGDAALGRDCNIGAGTIFCNYNGRTKNHSELGNNVFIGSNTSLVAPLKIGDNALIGAGSVITKNVDENDLAISRSPQTTIKNKGLKKWLE